VKNTFRQTGTRPVALTIGGLLLIGIFSGFPLLSQPASRDSLAVRQARQDWLQADFSVDNSTYAVTRAAINKQLSAGVKPSTLVQRYELNGKDVGDPRKIFRWAYAIYLQQKTEPDTNDLIKASSMLDRNLHPGAYDWIRLRFLVASMGGLERPDALTPIGRRLLKRKYDDPQVMFYFVRQMMRSQNREDRRVALALARQQLQQNPTDPYRQWAVSDATMFYLRYAGLTFEENKQILAEMEKTLRMLPASDKERKRLIEAIVVYRLHYDSNGKKLHHTLAEINQAIANTNLK